MNSYIVEPTTAFTRDIKKFRKDQKIKLAIKLTLKNMVRNPFDLSLMTHQVNISSLGKVWSSRVTSDLRLEWIFSKNNKLIIIALRLQGHDTVYK